ncbi:MAG TPA: succinylglutamate desuccinylase/aspartoacylase family protein, partial [Rectinema sp.]|nr:succinylglutamate desuccinylase/aspartoacylase family protein [Rectinema sp.]
PKGGDSFEGSESRNLNRVYPGKPDGTLTEQLAWAVMTLLKNEKVDIAFDLHEAGPESRLANMIVANPKNLDLGALAVINLELEGINMKLEPSSDVFHGLSHREWGDETNAFAFLIETPNPAQATDKGNPVEDSKFPLEERVATHLATIEAILDAWNSDSLPDKHIEFSMFPNWQDIKEQGIGKILNW